MDADRAPIAPRDVIIMCTGKARSGELLPVDLRDPSASLLNQRQA